MLDKGTVQASNMQPYLSAINNYHEDMGFPGPAKGRAISRAVKGMSRLQVQAAEAAGEEQTVRTWLPARHVSAVHAHGLGLEPVGRAATELLRACTYVVFAFVTFGRPETGVSMRREHISITGGEAAAAGAAAVVVAGRATGGVGDAVSGRVGGGGAWVVEFCGLWYCSGSWHGIVSGVGGGGVELSEGGRWWRRSWEAEQKVVAEAEMASTKKV
ncbi:hypothetical protein CYMTET_40303 [Cymbomonas tetramitiformis]|uniref:Uncharacterized protein n=1 Tax=Cymbomonas tetramitiformis TaxID=36881 RepID=A0AAE0F3S2_9CHLO|nr:hypothetical protein CYMTET_40303 [Cymbomonas tetramitiformis]